MKQLSVVLLAAAGLGAGPTGAARADGPLPVQLQNLLAAGPTAGSPGTDAVARALALGAVQTSGGNASATVAVAPGETAGRSLAARLYDIYNIADHGAMGDAASDNLAMNKALAYATANPGTHIFIPTGTWAFTVSSLWGFQFPAYTTLEGADELATVLTWNDTAGYYLLSDTGATGGTRTYGLTFQNFTLRGTWGTGGDYAVGNHGLFPSGVENLSVNHVTFDHSRGFGMAVRNGIGVWIHDNHVSYAPSDGINLSQCSNLSVQDNVVEHTDDDGISAHSDIYDTMGVRRNVDITGNTLFDTQGIDVLAARQANISGNTLDTVRQQGINVTTVQAGTTGTEGNSADEAVLITGNKITNVLRRDNIDNLNQGASAIVINGLSARPGPYAASPGEAAPATGNVVDPYPEFMANSQSASVAVAGGHSIVVEGNLIARTLPASNGSDPRYRQWTDFGQGTIASRTGPQNPHLAEADLQNGCITLSGGSLRDVLIQGNDCHGMSAGLVTAGSGHMADIVYRGNNDVDMTNYGVVINTNGLHDVLIEDNVFNLDPFQKSAARGPHGTWASVGGPTALSRQSGGSVVARDNVIRNAARDTDADPTNPAGGWLFENNLDEADPNFVGGFSTANKGIGFVHGTGFRLVQLDSDPASPTYDSILTAPASALPAMPTAGKWMQGQYVANSVPTATGPTGWLRLTSGTGNAAGTDWLALCPACGGVIAGLIQPNGGIAVAGTGLTVSPSGALATTQNAQVGSGATLTVGAWPQATLTASQALTSAQCGQRLWVNSASAVTLTVGALHAGCEVEVVQQAAGAVTGVAGAGETMLVGSSGANATTGPGSGFRISVSPSSAVFRVSVD